jgi:hypothetical protein
MLIIGLSRQKFLRSRLITQHSKYLWCKKMKFTELCMKYAVINLKINHVKTQGFNNFFPVALQSLNDLGRLTYRRFLELFIHILGLLGRVISPSQGLYLYRTAQHRKTRTNIHALSGIRTHDPSNQPAKTHASDRTDSVTGRVSIITGRNHESWLLFYTYYMCIRWDGPSWCVTCVHFLKL